VISDNLIHGNEAALDGGGVRFCYFYSELPRPVMRRTIIRDNVAPLGAGVLCADADTLTIEECVITGNIAAERGGGLYVHEGFNEPAIELTRCTVHDNTADEALSPPGGGGVYGGLIAGTITLRSCIVSANMGGGLVAASSSQPAAIDSDHCDVWGNSIADYSNCSPGTHSLSADPLFCAQPLPPPGDTRDSSWYEIHESSPCNGSGAGGHDIGAGGVGCFSLEDVVFYDNFSDQQDDRWVREEVVPGQIQVVSGEYSMHSLAEQVRSHVAALDVADLELRVHVRPRDTQPGGETRCFFRLTPLEETGYRIHIESRDGEGALVRLDQGVPTTLAMFACSLATEVWQQLTVTANGSALQGRWHGPAGSEQLFDVVDPAPLTTGTIAMGVASQPEQGAVRGGQLTHFDRVLVRDVSGTTAAPGNGTADFPRDAPRPRLVARPVPNPACAAVSFVLHFEGDGVGNMAMPPRAACLRVYDIQGRLVSATMPRVTGSALHGSGEIAWDTRTSTGGRVPSGVYFWEITAGNAESRGRLIVMR
jgi:hypothetical protein